MMLFAASRNPAKRAPPFAVLSLLASFLLFFFQPLMAKVALPQLCGNAGVWMSAMAAFQLLLLVGYSYPIGCLG